MTAGRRYGAGDWKRSRSAGVLPPGKHLRRRSVDPLQILAFSFVVVMAFGGAVWFVAGRFVETAFAACAALLMWRAAR